MTCMIALAALLATGCKPANEVAYEAEARLATENAVTIHSPASVRDIADCLDRSPGKPPRLVGLGLVTGAGRQFADHSEHILISLVDDGSGSSVAVRVKPGRPLPSTHQDALLRCMNTLGRRESPPLPDARTNLPPPVIDRLE